MHEEAADVAKGFDDAAEEEGDRVGVGAVAVAESDLGEGAEDEDGEEEGVEGEGGAVAIDCVLDGADIGELGTVVENLGHSEGMLLWVMEDVW